MLERWQDTPLGQRVYKAQFQWLQTVLPKTFGYYILQMGNTRLCTWLQSSPIQCHIGVETDRTLFVARSNIAKVVSCYDALPFAADSIDAVVIAHALAFCDDAKALLADVYRCLMPEGKVFILGLNRSALLKCGENTKILTKARYLKPSYLREQLTDLNYVVSPTYSLIQRPLMRASLLSGRLTDLEKRFWPDRAGCYAMVATKVVETLTPIRPRCGRNKKLRLKTWAGTQASVSTEKNKITP